MVAFEGDAVPSTEAGLCNERLLDTAGMEELPSDYSVRHQS